MIADKVRELLEPIAKERGYYVVDITYRREGGKFVLRIILDKDGGITLDECTGLNNELSGLLDKDNVIEEEYTLEVSSPGLDRKLKKDEDFVWAVGKRVKVSTYAPLDGRNVFSGVLVGLGDGTVVVDENGTSTEIAREKIANAKLALGAGNEQ
jgi:ribosome maturation factor RimP